VAKRLKFNSLNQHQKYKQPVILMNNIIFYTFYSTDSEIKMNAVLRQ